MTLQRTKLADIQYVPAPAGSIYANPAATKTFIRGLVLHNTNTMSNEIIKLYSVPDAAGAIGLASDSSRFFDVLLTPNETLIIGLPYPLVMTDTNDSIQAETSNASKVTVMLLGDKDI